MRHTEYCALCGGLYLHSVIFVNGDPRPGPLPLRWAAETRVGEYSSAREVGDKRGETASIYITKHLSSFVMGVFGGFGGGFAALPFLSPTLSA